MCSSVIADCYAIDHLAQSQAASPLLTNEFDLSEQILMVIFQTMSHCKYSKINSIFFNNQVEHLCLFQLNLGSLYKNGHDLQKIIYIL